MNFSKFKELTRLEQSLFGLPFVLAGALLGWKQCNSLMPLLWALPAFFAARISGMAFNQWIDCKIDAQNPRTKGRLIPSKQVAASSAAIIAITALFLFLLLCSMINPLCVSLGILASAIIACYSFTKRFTASCHFVLGSIHFLSPIMAFAAMTGIISWEAVVLGLASFSTIAGNDIIYSLQDFEFDRKHGVYSLPARVGIRRALFAALFLHLCSLVALSFLHPLLPFFIAGIFVLYYRKIFAVLTPSGLPYTITPLFFFSNFLVSLITLLFIAVRVLWIK